MASTAIASPPTDTTNKRKLRNRPAHAHSSHSAHQSEISAKELRRALLTLSPRPYACHCNRIDPGIRRTRRRVPPASERGLLSLLPVRRHADLAMEHDATYYVLLHERRTINSRSGLKNHNGEDRLEELVTAIDLPSPPWRASGIHSRGTTPAFVQITSRSSPGQKCQEDPESSSTRRWRRPKSLPQSC